MLILAWPVRVSDALRALYNLIFWLGKVSTQALSDPALSWPVIFTFMSLGSDIKLRGLSLSPSTPGPRASGSGWP
ncbi:hypothetical protein J7L84_01590 [Candidatus Bipolaricaulota bacterium]|nr:hypothetical protein [Candidatus Bipolaricaulota bacterium]